MPFSRRVLRAVLERWRALTSARPAIVWRARRGFERMLIRWGESGGKWSGH